LHPSTSSWFETAFGLLTRRWSDFDGLDLMVSLSNHVPHRLSAACPVPAIVLDKLDCVPNLHAPMRCRPPI
ncbi:MAG: hypothetical protein WA579_06540, partial [Rhodomicrobium sp.]